jgi:serine/threonine protein kinase
MADNASGKPPQSHDDMTGKQVGHFIIEKEIGRGGMATVYSARQTSMNRTVAIKILPRHFLHDPGFLERFEREVEVISQLEHPHILPIYDYGEADGVPFIAMRYLGGGSMAKMAEKAADDLTALTKPVRQIADALDYAHQQGVVHRDLKPANILLDDNQNAYLSDFGIARVMGSDLTGSAIVGTPAYMSPEQAQGDRIDARSDIYALGIVLFELITGQEPYQAATPMSLLLKHITEPVPPMSQFRDDVPQGVQDVIDRATAKDPADRYPSTGAMAIAFAAAVNNPVEAIDDASIIRGESRTITGKIELMSNEGGTLIDGRPTPAPGKSKKQPALTETDTTDTADRGTPWLLIAGFLLVIALVGGGAVFFLQGTSTTEAVILPTVTPFSGAVVVETDDYSISMPRAMLPDRDNYYDFSNADGLLHSWQEDSGLRVSLRMVRAGRYTVDEYYDDLYAPNDSLMLIDRATAPDGTVRRSYRVEPQQLPDDLPDRDATPPDDLPPRDDNGDAPRQATRPDAAQTGQLDVFLMERGENLVAIEMFTPDAIEPDAETVAVLQRVLDSLRVRG